MSRGWGSRWGENSRGPAGSRWCFVNDWREALMKRQQGWQSWCDASSFLKFRAQVFPLLHPALHQLICCPDNALTHWTALSVEWSMDRGVCACICVHALLFFFAVALWCVEKFVLHSESLLTFSAACHVELKGMVPHFWMAVSTELP